MATSAAASRKGQGLGPIARGCRARGRLCRGRLVEVGWSRSAGRGRLVEVGWSRSAGRGRLVEVGWSRSAEAGGAGSASTGDRGRRSEPGRGRPCGVSVALARQMHPGEGCATLLANSRDVISFAMLCSRSYSRNWVQSAHLVAVRCK